MPQTDLDKLLEIKSIFNSPGQIFYGEISDEGIVSQDVADAEEHFKWLIEQAEIAKTLQANIDVALYELNLLYKKISPSKNSNLDRHIKTIISLLKDEF